MKLLREPQVLALVGFSRTTLHNKVKAGTFPKPKRISERMKGWVEADVIGWIAELQEVGAKK